MYLEIGQYNTTSSALCIYVRYCLIYNIKYYDSILYGHIIITVKHARLVPLIAIYN